MKIHFITFDVFGMGGTVRTVLNTANYLVEHNYEVEIISVMRHRREPFFHIDPRINVVVLHEKISKNRGRNGIKGKIISITENTKSAFINKNDEGIVKFSLLTDLKMLRYIKSIKEGVLVSTRPSFNLFCAKYANENVMKIGQEHITFDVYPESLQAEIKKVYPKLNYLTTLTDGDTEVYSELFKGQNLKVIKLTNSIPNYSGQVSDLNSKTIVTAGRLVPEKGYDLLIEAFKKVVDFDPEWKLKIYGSGREKDNLIDKISEEHLYNNVFLMGATQDVQNEFKNSSIFALSSKHEGFGMVIIEAMQCGLPVVSFDCPKGPREIIKDGVDGILVEPENVEKLSEALLELVEKKDKRKAIAENAIKNVSRFSVEEIGKLWDDLFNKIDKRAE